MEKSLSKEEVKQFGVLVKKAVAQATNSQNAKIAVRVSGRYFPDGSCGIGFICWNKSGQEFTLIKKVPEALLDEQKTMYREHLRSFCNPTA